jgi:hypothetical protein
MNYIAGSDRGEGLLLPEVLDDYIAAENPVRFIEAFVARLDLGKEGFAKAQLNETGRPPYDPGDLLRLYLYGYLNRVRSSRGLAPSSLIPRPARFGVKNCLNATTTRPAPLKRPLKPDLSHSLAPG